MKHVIKEWMIGRTGGIRQDDAEQEYVRISQGMSTTMTLLDRDVANANSVLVTNAPKLFNLLSELRDSGLVTRDDVATTLDTIIDAYADNGISLLTDVEVTS